MVLHLDITFCNTRIMVMDDMIQHREIIVSRPCIYLIVAVHIFYAHFKMFPLQVQLRKLSTDIFFGLTVNYL